MRPPGWARLRSTGPELPDHRVVQCRNDIAVFDPDIEVPHTDSWSFGLQRSVGRDTAVEVRYIGNKKNGPWDDQNWNVENIAGR